MTTTWSRPSSTTFTVTFVDTSGVYALLDTRDAAHGQATDLWRNLLHSGEPLLTSSYVLVEASALVQRRFGMEALRVLHEDLLAPVEIRWVDASVHAIALAALFTAGRRALSLVDCASFVIMRANGVRQAFAFDEHFREQGFQIACA